jgi:D-3-phosphoglycerate dehydrogenase / 2-oxoglutarate reductase
MPCASGRIRHAGLDVFEAEPLRPRSSACRHGEVTITAHAGFRTLEASMTLLRRAIEIAGGIVALQLR